MKIAQGMRPCGAFIFDILIKSQKFQFWGSYTLIVAPMGVKFDVEEGTFGPLLHAKIHPYRCNVPPLWGEKPQNRFLSNLNTALCTVRNAAGNKLVLICFLSTRLAGKSISKMCRVVCKTLTQSTNMNKSFHCKLYE